MKMQLINTVDKIIKHKMLNIILLFLQISHMTSGKLEIFNLNQNPLAVLEIGTCRIKTGETRIIHIINLTQIANCKSFCCSKICVC